MAVVIMEPLKGGTLANPPAEAVNVMKNSTVEHSSVGWALRFLWNLPEVSVVLSGMNKMRELEENCAYAEQSGIDRYIECGGA